MNPNIILVAETGSDITPELADQHNIFLVPMHVAMGDVTLDEGTFPPEDVCAYYDRTGKVPTTSGSTPEDFIRVFDDIHARYPDAHILHLAYSAVTTCSYHSALLAAEGRSYVTSVDTKHVSVGQAVVVLETARLLAAQPDLTVEQAVAAVEEISRRTHMCFIPKNLDYLRAGGRVSNVVALTGNLLGLHPCIEILDGRLLAKKKYRGHLEKVIPKLIVEYAQAASLNREQLYLIRSCGLPQSIQALAEETAHSCSFRQIHWLNTGCVITCHGGPGAFGIVGLSDQ